MADIIPRQHKAVGDIAFTPAKTHANMIGEGTRQLDLYDFFSILIPGAVFTLALTPFLPENVAPTSPALVVGILIFGFVFGRAAHALGIQVERLDVATSHREYFQDQLFEPDEISPTMIDKFYSQARIEFALSELPENQDELERDSHEEELNTLYTMVRGMIHMDSRGRSRTFQAVLDFYRSMMIIALVIFVVCTGYAIVLAAGGTSELLPYNSHLASFDILPAVSFFIGVIIAVSAYTSFERIRSQYRSYYVQYLMADYLLIHKEKTESSPKSVYWKNN